MNEPNNISFYRKTAREALRGQWGAYATSGMMVAIVVTICALPIFSYVGFPNIRAGEENTLNVWWSITMLILSPLTWRYITLSLHTLRGERIDMASVFDGFRYTRKYMLTYFIYTAIFSLASFCVMACAMLAYNAYLNFAKEPSPTMILATGVACAATLFVIVWTYALKYSYALTPYFLHDGNMEGYAVLHLSKDAMKGHRWRLFVLDLTFVGWYFLGFLTLGLGLLWVVPYHQTARAAYYANVMLTMQNTTNTNIN